MLARYSTDSRQLCGQARPEAPLQIVNVTVTDGNVRLCVSAVGDLGAHGRLIVELIEKSRLPAMYPYRAYVETGGLMAYASDR